MAQTTEADSTGVAIGEWGSDAVFWVVENGEWLFDPFADITRWLLDTLLGDQQNGLLHDLPDAAWPLAFFLIGLATWRPTRERRLRSPLCMPSLVGSRTSSSTLWGFS